ncbi:hypothetical protein AWB67_06451 [Caballeronia terrestris]|jgi:hypothetical protein|uniref:Uncharacterized protein n=1 Tax=Caballeronia terrestris TaxID=1226301 RepID=A0A158KR87_9BURK|nr:hypothetical protein [Caballeronia terrestris]SAL83594.1 hypothetical protein AWB67_06451 [Caballeronia terrestris]
MSLYTALFAIDVPHYGTRTIEALTPAAAIKAAKTLDPADLCDDPDWGNAACARIVSIKDETHRQLIAEDVALDGAFLRYGGRQAFLLCEAAPALLDAVQKLAAQAHALLAAIESASDRFEDPAARLAEAASHAEQVIATAEGATDQ